MAVEDVKENDRPCTASTNIPSCPSRLAPSRFHMERPAHDGPRRRNPLFGALRQRRPRLRPSRQGRRRPGHLLRQRPVLPMLGPGRRHPGQVLHGARPARHARRARRGPAGASPASTPARPASTAARPIEDVRVPVLIIGGGPAGLSAAIELGRRGIETLLIDDKHRLGGKLVLQTHRFFGSIEAVYAGTRGIDIATRLENDVRSFPASQGLAPEHGRGRLQRQEGRRPRRRPEIRPRRARGPAGRRPAPGRRTWLFPATPCPASTAPAPSRPSSTATWSGPRAGCSSSAGGNVGLIAGYHALQAGIAVVGLVEVMPECGGYKVHRDKLARLGVPIYTSHTVLSANGADAVDVGHHRPGRRALPARPGTGEVVRLRHPAYRRRPGSRSTSSTRRPASSAWRPSPPETPRRSPRPPRPSFRARSGASKSPGPSATTSARSRRIGTGRPTS